MNSKLDQLVAFALGFATAGVFVLLLADRIAAEKTPHQTAYFGGITIRSAQ
jgi:hypothetical protein